MKYQDLPEEKKVKMRAATRRYYWRNAEEGRARSRRYARKWYAQHRNSVKNWQLKSTYGISLAEYEMMLQMQDNKCALCKEPFGARTGRGRPHVDHCHKTGKVRGLLHHNCNVALGFIERNPIILERAKEYLGCE